MNISELLSNITPLYNKYKLNKDSAPASESILIMWEIGKSIEKYLTINTTAPHNLYRSIYGKSESNINIVQRSYITREFLSRSYRIFKMFQTEEEIKSKFRKLKYFSSFREAMPFFDNPIYKLSNNDEIQLLKLLNSNKKSSEIVKELDKKKKAINNINNPRDQRLSELNNEVTNFKIFYNYIFKLIRDNDYDECIYELKIRKTDFENIIILYKNLGTLSQEGMLKYEMLEIKFENEYLKTFYYIIKDLMKPNDEKIRRRFRRLIPPEKIFKTSEFIHSITSIESFLKMKNKITK